MVPVLALALLLLAPPARAETVVATRTIRPQEILTRADVTLHPAETPGTYATLSEVVGLETRVALYAGRPVHRADLGPPALVERNQIVRLVYAHAGLVILAEGRALERAGLGERLRVMNLTSRATLTGRVQEDGSVRVSP